MNEYPTPALGISYQEQMFSESDLATLTRTLNDAGIQLYSQSYPPQILLGIEIFFPQALISISPDIVIGICTGILASAAYDAIKAAIRYIYRAHRKSLLHKVQSNKVCKPDRPNIQIEVGKMHIILPKDVDQEKFDHFIDKAFKLIDNSTVNSQNYVTCANETGEAKLHTREEMVQEIINEHRKKQDENSITQDRGKSESTSDPSELSP